MRDPRLLPMKEVGWTTWGSITHKINSNNNDTMSNNSSSIINNSTSSTTNSTTHRQGTPIILPPPSRILVGRLGSVYCFHTVRLRALSVRTLPTFCLDICTRGGIFCSVAGVSLPYSDMGGWQGEDCVQSDGSCVLVTP